MLRYETKTQSVILHKLTVYHGLEVSVMYVVNMCIAFKHTRCSMILCCSKNMRLAAGFFSDLLIPFLQIHQVRSIYRMITDSRRAPVRYRLVHVIVLEIHLQTVRALVGMTDTFFKATSSTSRTALLMMSLSSVDEAAASVRVTEEK